MIKVNTLQYNKYKEREGRMDYLYWFTKKTNKKSSSTRFIELDILRGFAIIFMVILHILWDLDYFNILPLNISVYQFNIIVPTMFFLLVGICLAVTNNRPSSSKTTPYLRTIQRGAWVFTLGMILTLLTALALPDRPILFGVLHCIGLSMILALPFLRFKSYNIIIAGGIIFIGVLIASIPVQNPTILQVALGFHARDIFTQTIDYFPILPWIGVCLLGVGLGNILYKDNKRKFSFPDLSRYTPAKFFSWLGRHSLAIYLLHQPIIAGALFVFFKI